MESKVLVPSIAFPAAIGYAPFENSFPDRLDLLRPNLQSHTTGLQHVRLLVLDILAADNISNNKLT